MMTMLEHLWLPIVLSAVAVWIASALGWMLIGHHHQDWSKLPDEERVITAIRSFNLPPGNYGFPHFGRKECNTPEAKKKWEEGPVGLLNVWGKVNMGRNMVLTVIVCLIISTVIAYLGAAAELHKEQGFGKLFQVLGTAGVLGYTFATLPGDIWFQKYPRAILMGVIDGVVFGLISGAIFAALWPAATAALQMPKL